jgi:hypothetical protein
MIFIMKFQAAAMGRADIPEDQRQDFTLYVDEFQNFATDSFESILSEARKYRLTVVLANQFMTQLTDKIREAIIGNIGTVISGRIGITDAEILQKKFSPVFDAEDLTRLPNFQTVASVMINNVPSAAFSMSLVPSMGEANPKLREALKNLSAAKFGRPRAEVEREIFGRLGAGDAAKKAKVDAMRQAQQQRINAYQNAGPAGMSPQGPPMTPQGGAPAGGGSSFLDEWLAKRQQITNQPSSTPATPAPNPAYGPTTGDRASLQPSEAPIEATVEVPVASATSSEERIDETPSETQPIKDDQGDHPHDKHKLHIRDPKKGDGHEVSIKLR